LNYEARQRRNQRILKYLAENNDKRQTLQTWLHELNKNVLNSKYSLRSTKQLAKIFKYFRDNKICDDDCCIVEKTSEPRNMGINSTVQVHFYELKKLKKKCSCGLIQEKNKDLFLSAPTCTNCKIKMKLIKVRLDENKEDVSELTYQCKWPHCYRKISVLVKENNQVEEFHQNNNYGIIQHVTRTTH